MSILVKSNYMNDLRVFELLDSILFESLQQEVENQYGLRRNEFSVKFQDSEGEDVTIASDTDLKLALRLTKKIFRIKICPVGEWREREKERSIRQLTKCLEELGIMHLDEEEKAVLWTEMCSLPDLKDMAKNGTSLKKRKNFSLGFVAHILKEERGWAIPGHHIYYLLRKFGLEAKDLVDLGLLHQMQKQHAAKDLKSQYHLLQEFVPANELTGSNRQPNLPSMQGCPCIQGGWLGRGRGVARGGLGFGRGRGRGRSRGREALRFSGPCMYCCPPAAPPHHHHCPPPPPHPCRVNEPRGASEDEKDALDGLRLARAIEESLGLGPGPEDGSRQQRRKTPCPVRFLRHVTLDDSGAAAASALPGERLVKVWRVRNDSGAPWPAACELVRVGGGGGGRAQLLSARATAVAGGLLPGREADVAVAVRVPPGAAAAGVRVAEGHWRLRAADGGGKLGQRLWAAVAVGGGEGEGGSACAPATTPGGAGSFLSGEEEEGGEGDDGIPNFVREIAMEYAA